MPKFEGCTWEEHGGYGILRDASGREVGLLKMFEEPEQQTVIRSHKESIREEIKQYGRKHKRLTGTI